MSNEKPPAKDVESFKHLDDLKDEVTHVITKFEELEEDCEDMVIPNKDGQIMMVLHGKKAIKEFIDDQQQFIRDYALGKFSQEPKWKKEKQKKIIREQFGNLPPEKQKIAESLLF